MMKPSTIGVMNGDSGKDAAVADDCDGQRPEHRAEHRAAAAEQVRSAQHNRGDDFEFEAPAGVLGSASEAAGE